MSTMVCEVEGCITNTTNFSKEFYPFPKIKCIRDIWVKFCEKPISFQNNTKYICSLHFEETAFITEIGEENGNTVLIRKLNLTAIPTLNKPNFSSESSNPTKYGHIRNYQDLKVLKDNNKSLEEKIQKLTDEISSLNGTIASQARQVRSISTCAKNSPAYLNTRNQGVLSKVFTPSQIRSLAGNKKTQWSNDDKAIAVTIRYLTSTKFYDYLINQLNYPLPARSSIRRVASGTRQKRLPKLSITKEC